MKNFLIQGKENQEKTKDHGPKENEKMKVALRGQKEDINKLNSKNKKQLHFFLFLIFFSIFVSIFLS